MGKISAFLMFLLVRFYFVRKFGVTHVWLQKCEGFGELTSLYSQGIVVLDLTTLG